MRYFAMVIPARKHVAIRPALCSETSKFGMVWLACFALASFFRIEAVLGSFARTTALSAAIAVGASVASASSDLLGQEAEIEAICIKEELSVPSEIIEFLRQWRLGDEITYVQCIERYFGLLDEESRFVVTFSLLDRLNGLSVREIEAGSPGLRQKFVVHLSEARFSGISRERYVLYISYYFKFYSTPDRRLSDLDYYQLSEIQAVIYCFVQNDIPWKSFDEIQDTTNYLSCISERAAKP